jgi:hypothetical protein
MDDDFPAAHSMDTQWFAIDHNGYVARFFTGAGGAVPNGAYCPDALDELEDMDLDEETRAELGVDALPDIPADQLPDDKRLFLYKTSAFDECLADRYERTSVPKKPIHVDELPPQVRAAIAAMRFDGLDFATTKVFQPIELTACATWDPAYLTGDGKTVKAVPGREKEYASFYEENRADFGEDDGLTVEPPPKKNRKPRGKKKGEADE